MEPTSDKNLLFPLLRNSIWLIGIACWLFGLTDRSLASLADGYLSAVDLLQLFTALFFFICWLSLKPEQPFAGESLQKSRYGGE